MGMENAILRTGVNFLRRPFSPPSAYSEWSGIAVRVH